MANIPLIITVNVFQTVDFKLSRDLESVLKREHYVPFDTHVGGDDTRVDGDAMAQSILESHRFFKPSMSKVRSRH